MLVKLRPNAHQTYRSLPILGPIIDEFTVWSHHCGYALSSLKHQLDHLRTLTRFLQRCGLKNWKELTLDHLEAAWEKLPLRCPNIGGTIRQMQRFLRECHGLVSRPSQPTSRVESEVQGYGEHLQHVCGYAESTIALCQSHARAFLEYIGYEQSASALAQLTLEQIEAFVSSQGKKCNRYTLQGVVSHLRGFLRFQHTKGVIPRPLYAMIEMPRVYRMERLPRALPWPQVQLLLRSIDRDEPHGLRDHTLLFLMAAYGLRSSEVVALTLDDISWRARTLRVPQRKTQQNLLLPLTDEAGDLLQRYLRKAHRPKDQRVLFCRQRAPEGPLAASAVNTILKRRIKRSGLPLGTVGSHCLRHSLATRLLRQGVSMKVIGDALGHRALASTDVYLRLGIEDLRQVGLEVPHSTASKALLAPGWENQIPRVRPEIDSTPVRTTGFHSGWASALQRYLEIKQGLGRKYANETRVLRHWDAFLHQHQSQPEGWSERTFQHWAQCLERLNPRVQRLYLQIVRNFLLYHTRDHTAVFVPDLATFPKPSAPRPPRLVSEAEMARVLATASEMKALPGSPLRAETVRMALVLLFCCGLRRGELMRLQWSHFDPEENLLRIEKTKFHKSRLVPLSSSVAQELRNFFELRRQKNLPVEPNSFLMGFREPVARPVSYQGAQLGQHWRYLCATVGVLDARGCPPRLHDLRHSFAACALARWYAGHEDVQSKLPHLASYLGHINAASTHYYLHLTPQLREAASQRFQHRFEPMFRQGGQP